MLKLEVEYYLLEVCYQFTIVFCEIIYNNSILRSHGKTSATSNFNIGCCLAKDQLGLQPG